MLDIYVCTLFPNAFPGPLGVSLLQKSLNKKWTLNIVDMRPNELDKVDDTVFGGGAGMLITANFVEKAILKCGIEDALIIYTSPRGKTLSVDQCIKFSKYNKIIIICGRYEGVDYRVIEKYNILELSIGDFVLMGGETAAIAIIESTVRMINGVVGDSESLEQDSFSDSLLEHNQYTKPRSWQNIDVPDVVISGNEKKILEYRKIESIKLTMKRRPDIFCKYVYKKLT